MIRLLALLAVLICAAPALAQQLPPGADPQNTLLIDTKYGRIVIKLRNDIAPKHVERIKLLAREKFYDNVPFHRVIAGFMAQTGDGQRGDGTGGSKYPNLPAEFSNVPFKRGHRRHGARATIRIPPIGSSSSCMPTARSSTASTRWSGKCSPAWTWSTRSRRASRWSIPTA